MSTFVAESLPIWEQAGRLLRSVHENSVTLTVAGTGVGKSTQIPQMLLKHFGAEGKIVCSQPRRLAAVAIAERVAFERGGVVGGEVGYEVGQRRRVSAKTRVTFLTAGLLLRRLKAEGDKVFEGVSALVVDEVHERSVESDVTLACVRRLFGQSRDLRRRLKIVLVSATLDVTRYRDYWQLGKDDHVNVVTLDAVGGPQRSTFRVVDERYSDALDRFLRPEARKWGGELRLTEESLKTLNDTVRGLAVDRDDDSLLLRYSLSKTFHDAVAGVVRHCYFEELDREKSDMSTRATLVFLPTYRCLEKQYETLRAMTDLKDVKILILHSSIDLDASVAALAGRKNKTMTIILATNVAESSLTIPDVVDVIDSCLTNQIVFSHSPRRSAPRVVFASRTQLTQRKGRAGRVRSGRVWRLLPPSVYAGLDDYETPALQLCCLDDVVLALVASKSNALKQVQKVLGDTLDPPNPQNVKLAIDFLASVDVVQVRTRNAVLPTKYGQLLAEMPVAVDVARFATTIAFATCDLRAASLLAACRAAVPKPILRPFGSSLKYARHLERYSKRAAKAVVDRRKGGSSNSSADEARESFDELLAHYAAYEFYEGVFRDRERKSDRFDTSYSAEAANFAARHDLVLSALHDVEATARAVFACFHRHRVFMLEREQLPKPAFLRLRDHVCVVELCVVEPRQGQDDDDEDVPVGVCTPGSSVAHEMVSQLFLSSSADELLEIFRSAFYPGQAAPAPVVIPDNDPRPPCRFFVLGQCRYADDCRFAHRAGPPRNCVHFARGLCRFGDDCAFQHSATPQQQRPTHDTEESGVRKINDGGGADDDDARHVDRWSGHRAVFVVDSPNLAESLATKNDRVVVSDHLRNFDVTEDEWLEALPEDFSFADLVVVVPGGGRDGGVDSDSDSSKEGDEQERRIGNLTQDIRGIFRGASDFAWKTVAGPDETNDNIRLDLVLRVDDFVESQVTDLAQDRFFYLDETFPYDDDAFPDPGLPPKRQRSSPRKAVYSFVYRGPPDIPACSICLDSFHVDKPNATMRLDCDHFLHRSCADDLRRATGGRLICPLCRRGHPRQKTTLVNDTPYGSFVMVGYDDTSPY